MNEAESKAQYEKMTLTPIPKLIRSLAVPTIISMLITGIYNLADTYFVSCLRSDSATAAVGVVFSLMALIQAAGFGLGMGSGSLISRLLGQQKKDEAEQVMSSGFAAALVIGLVITVCGITFLTPLMKLLGSTDTILPYARSYAQYILFGAPIMISSFVLNKCLLSEGHAALSMAGITAGGVLNILLDPLFIFGLDMGIAGAAVATLISQCVSFVILLVLSLSPKSILRPSPRKVSLRPGRYGSILATGMPSFFRQGLASVAAIALNHAAVPYGDPAVAAMSVVGKVFMLIMAALIGFGQGYQPAMGYNYGARRYDRAREALAYALRTGTLLMSVLAVAGFLAAPWVIGAFGSGRMKEIGVAAMRFQCLAMPFQAVNVLSNMTFQTIGRAGLGTFLASCRQGVYYLPLIVILPFFFDLTGVEMTQAVSDVLTCLTCVPFLLRFRSQLIELEGTLPQEA